jgi:D-threo-aldose 1-dehydrogenase
MTLEYAARTMARTGLRMSEIGFGAAPLGNLYRAISDEEALQTCRAALESGITYFDTAPYYGFGLSESRLGSALRGETASLISTKVGRILTPDPAADLGSIRSGFLSPMPFSPAFDYRYDAMMASWEASLRRLDMAAVDILYIHDIGFLTHGQMSEHYFAQLTQGGGLRALEELRAHGAIKAYGVGVNEIDVCLKVMDHADIDVILLAGRYTLLEQDALQRLLPECGRRRVSVVIGGPYNSGILAMGTHTGGPITYDYASAPPLIVDRVRQLEACCGNFNVPLAAAALQFPLGHPNVVSVIPGLNSPEQVRETRALYETVIPAEFWDALKAKGLLRPDAPTGFASPRL